MIVGWVAHGPIRICQGHKSPQVVGSQSLSRQAELLLVPSPFGYVHLWLVFLLGAARVPLAQLGFFGSGYPQLPLILMYLDCQSPFPEAHLLLLFAHYFPNITG